MKKDTTMKSGFGAKSMEEALDAAAAEHDDFMPGNRPINYGGGQSYETDGSMHTNEHNKQSGRSVHFDGSKVKENAYPKGKSNKGY